MGVTVLKDWPFSSDLLLSGSYDKTLKLWDKRKIGSRQPVQEYDLGLQIWDVDFGEDQAIAVSCVHDG